MLKIIFMLVFALITLCADELRADDSGLSLSLAGDMLYDQGLNEDSEAEEKLTMRGAELSFFSPIDHQFDGVLSAAAHDEGGETVFELHELYIENTKLIPQSSFKMGQFFLGVGRLNRFHQHDWLFTTAPKVHRSFFADEGVFDAGLEYSYFIPSESPFKITAGLTSGHRYGHAHSAGSKPKMPTHYLRLSHFHENKVIGAWEMGANYLGRTDEQDNKMSIAGLDFIYKEKTKRLASKTFQTEFWYKKETDGQKEQTEQVGTYLFYDQLFTESTTLGLGLDLFKDLSKTNAITLKKINNVSYGQKLQITYHSSEFLKLRPTFSHEFTREEGLTMEKDTRVELQLVFILGSHPAHEF
jgi:hypothetical protein